MTRARERNHRQRRFRPRNFAGFLQTCVKNYSPRVSPSSRSQPESKPPRPRQVLRIRDVHVALYSDTGATYQEVFKVLPRLVPEDAIKNVPLLGGHGDGSSTEGRLEHRSPVLFDVVRSIVEHWPQPPESIQGRSLADVLKDCAVQPTRLPSNRALLRKLIRKIADFDGAGAVDRFVRIVWRLRPRSRLSIVARR